MTGPPDATAAVRVAVRRCLGDLPADVPVAVAASGGADSLALAAALAFERPGSSALVVDHSQQPSSAQVAELAAEHCRSLGLTSVVLRPDPRAQPAGGGPEARARQLRYAALDAAAQRAGLAAVLLGHTLDDQAETVLLGLARGSGARALAGMAAVRGRYRRPLLALRRATTRAACDQAGLTPWEDPHNRDRSYARVRVRVEVLPLLEAQLGPGVAGNLARTARQLREDADALDALAEAAQLHGSDVDCVAMTALLPAVRTRVLKRWAERGCAAPVTSAHVDALRSLVDAWHGQGPVALPGGILVHRVGSHLRMSAPPGPCASPSN